MKKALAAITGFEESDIKQWWFSQDTSSTSKEPCYSFSISNSTYEVKLSEIIDWISESV